METSSGNRISRNSKIVGASNILLLGNCTINDNCSLRSNGPTQLIQLGKYSYVGANCVIKPHTKTRIGSFVIIMDNTIVQSLSIGNMVYIGKNCKLGNNCVIGNNLILSDNIEIPEKMIIPAFSRVRQMENGDLDVRDLNNGYKKLIENAARELYLGCEVDLEEFR